MVPFEKNIIIDQDSWKELASGISPKNFHGAVNLWNEMMNTKEQHFNNGARVTINSVCPWRYMKDNEVMIDLAFHDMLLRRSPKNV